MAISDISVLMAGRKQSCIWIAFCVIFTLIIVGTVKYLFALQPEGAKTLNPLSTKSQLISTVDNESSTVEPEGKVRAKRSLHSTEVAETVQGMEMHLNTDYPHQLQLRRIRQMSQQKRCNLKLMAEIKRHWDVLSFNREIRAAYYNQWCRCFCRKTLAGEPSKEDGKFNAVKL